MDEQHLIKWITRLLEENKIIYFYHSAIWKRKRKEILDKHHNECYECRKQGKITTKHIKGNGQTKGIEIHHVYHIDKYPQYALSEYVIDEQGNKVMNLVPLCVAHHLEAHPEKKARAKARNEARAKKKAEAKANNIAPERW